MPAAKSLDLGVLRSFLTVVEAGSFTAAAAVLDTTQSTISMQIRRLERDLATPLFHREGRSVRLTVEGERLQAHAREMVRLNDEAWRDLTGATLSGAVRLGIPDDYAFYLPDALRDFAEAHPGVNLDVRCDLSVALVDRVRRGELDLALVTRQARSPGGEVLRREPLVWGTARSRAVEHSDPVPLAVYPREACVFREHATRALTEVGRRWRVIYTSKSITGQQAMVRAGLAVTPTMASMVASDMRVLDEGAGLPALPSVEIALHRAPGRPSEPARRLYDTIRERLAA